MPCHTCDNKFSASLHVAAERMQKPGDEASYLQHVVDFKAKCQDNWAESCQMVEPTPKNICSTRVGLELCVTK